MQGWAKILGKRLAGLWLAQGVWRPRLDGPQQSTCLKKSARWQARRASSLRPRHGGPGDHGLWQCRTAKRFCPASPAAKSGGARATANPAGLDLASVKTRAERVGDKYIVNGQKTWTTLGQYGDWMFNLVRTSTEGKPQTGISSCWWT